LTRYYTGKLQEPHPVRPISPPGSRMPAPVLERWVRAGDLGRLEDALLEGRGPRLLKLIASAAREPPMKSFVNRAPIFLVSLLVFFTVIFDTFIT
jgi:hypothetical protein